MNLWFFHGLESGPHGSKYQNMVEDFGHVHAPDFRGMGDVQVRLAKAVEATEGQTGMILVGSSFGGLVASLLASQYPERVAGLLLLAPAVHLPDALKVVQVPRNTWIIHGRQDDIVPLEAVELFAKEHDVPLTVVEDGHRLKDQSNLIANVIQRIAKDAQ
jgi:pimeloyl-ACP methyl ester carboxylesterase